MKKVKICGHPPECPPRPFSGEVINLTNRYVFFERQERQLVEHLNSVCGLNLEWSEEIRQVENPYTFTLLLEDGKATGALEEVQNFLRNKRSFDFFSCTVVVLSAPMMRLKKAATRNSMQSHFGVLFSWEDVEGTDETIVTVESREKEKLVNFQNYLKWFCQGVPMAKSLCKEITQPLYMSLFLDVSGMNTAAETSWYNSIEAFVSLKGSHFLEAVIHSRKLMKCVVGSHRWVPDKGKFKYFVDKLNPVLEKNGMDVCKSLYLPDIMYTGLEERFCSEANEILNEDHVNQCSVYTFALGEDTEGDKAFLNGELYEGRRHLDLFINVLLAQRKKVEIWLWKMASPGKYFYLRRKYGANKNFKIILMEDFKDLMLFSSPRENRSV